MMLPLPGGGTGGGHLDEAQMLRGDASTKPEEVAVADTAEAASPPSAPVPQDMAVGHILATITKTWPLANVVMPGSSKDGPPSPAESTSWWV